MAKKMKVRNMRLFGLFSSNIVLSVAKLHGLNAFSISEKAYTIVIYILFLIIQGFIVQQNWRLILDKSFIKIFQFYLHHVSSFLIISVALTLGLIKSTKLIEEQAQKFRVLDKEMISLGIKVNNVISNRTEIRLIVITCILPVALELMSNLTDRKFESANYYLRYLEMLQNIYICSFMGIVCCLPAVSFLKIQKRLAIVNAYMHNQMKSPRIKNIEFAIEKSFDLRHRLLTIAQDVNKNHSFPLLLILSTVFLRLPVFVCVIYRRITMQLLVQYTINSTDIVSVLTGLANVGPLIYAGRKTVLESERMGTLIHDDTVTEYVDRLMEKICRVSLHLYCDTLELSVYGIFNLGRTEDIIPLMRTAAIYVLLFAQVPSIFT